MSVSWCSKLLLNVSAISTEYSFILLEISFLPFIIILSALFFLFQHGTVATSSETSVGTQPGGSMTSRAASETPQVPSSSSSHQTGAKFRHGLLQLMIHTIDPLHDGQYAGSPSNFTLIDVVTLLLIMVWTSLA